MSNFPEQQRKISSRNDSECESSEPTARIYPFSFYRLSQTTDRAHVVFLICFAWFVVVTSPLRGESVSLVEHAQTDYAISLQKDAIPAEHFAAKELAHHIHKISGATLPITITHPGDPLPEKAVVIAGPEHLSKYGIDLQGRSLKKEEYIIQITGKRLFIVGGRPRGALYGVYALLQDDLGCRWFAPDTSHVPHHETILLSDIDRRDCPAFEYREPWIYSGYIFSTWWRDHFVPEYIPRTRNSARQINTHVHKVSDQYGSHFKILNFGHNMSRLVSSKLYAKTHPEYFALNNGKRITTGDLELCLSNPDLPDIVAEKIEQWLTEHPDTDMVFLGQSDTDKYCRCKQCEKLYRKYSRKPDGTDYAIRGGLAGRNLFFANKVAEILEKKYPTMPVGMYAYQTTRIPPKYLKAHPNLVIWYCPIERCVCHPIAKGPINQGFYDFSGDIKKWKRIAKKIYVYDYWLGMGMGMPSDLLTLEETIRTYHRLGVSGVLVDSIIDIQAGFGFCRHYLWSQLLRKPFINSKIALQEFLEAYYGAASPYIKDFIRLASDPTMYEPLPPQKADIWIPEHIPSRNRLIHKCHLGHRQLTLNGIERSYILFEKALHAVRDAPKSLRHVKSARMILQYAMMEQLPATDKRLKDEARSFFQMAESLEMPSIQKVAVDQYRAKIQKKIMNFGDKSALQTN